MKWLLICGLLVLAVAAVGYRALQSDVFDTGSPLRVGEGPLVLLDETLSIDELPQGWAHRSFFRITPTDYKMVEEDNRQALQCTSNSSGSILAREMDVPVETLPVLSWNWKITHPINSEVDEDTKEGDDHPARFFLRFENEAREKIHTEIIWSNQKYLPGEYKIIGDFYHLVANGLDVNVGSWHSESIHLGKLYKDIGGTGIPTLKVLGFFCDSDNAGGQSKAFFNDVTLSAN